MEKCIDCGVELSEENMTSVKDKKSKKKCKKCHHKSRVELYKNTKIKAVEYKGGKCEVCGYDRCYAALEFHHKDPSEKEYQMSRMRMFSFEKIKKELDKCICVCANCHREIHNRIYLESVP